MHPKMRIHKVLVVESHQDLQRDKKQARTLNQSGSRMSNRDHAARSEGEIKSFLLGKPSTETNSLELLHRAIEQGDSEAREYIQQIFRAPVLSWLRLHPMLGAIVQLDEEEHYVAKTFEYFWQSTTSRQRIEFDSLAVALQFLRASLNGVILDLQRANSRSKAIDSSNPGQAGELHMGDSVGCRDVWDTLKKVIPHGEEQRLAYLLFHCGLKPMQITQYFPQEFSEEHDVNRLRSSILDRAARNKDLFCWGQH